VLRESPVFDTGMTRLGPVSVRLIATTDRQGRYRLGQIPPGTYYVIALPPLIPGVPAGRAGHAVTYYPGALDSSEARTLVVGERGSVTVDFPLARTRLSTISGVAYGSNGRPIPGGQLQLGNGPPLFGVGGFAVAIARDGSFRTLALPPGRYSLQTSDGQTARAMSGVIDPIMSGAQVTLGERDVTGIEVRQIRMVKVSGRLILGPASRGLVLSNFSVGAAPLTSEGPAGPTPPGILRDDLTFEFRVWPKPSIVRVSRRGLASPTEPRPVSPPVAAVRLNGVDLTKTGIDFRERQDVSGLVVELP
jgi:hypothetical protein